MFTIGVLEYTMAEIPVLDGTAYQIALQEVRGFRGLFPDEYQEIVELF